jgi:predicted nucleic acid-binding protein
MSADRGEFVDANVLVYVLDSSAGEKHATAGALVERLWDEGVGCVSVQVLQEFFVTVTRKIPKPLSTDDALDRVRDLKAWTVFSPKADDVIAAINLHKRHGINFWDAMIVEAASEMRCDVLWTEDLSNGQVLEGVTVRNPFAARDAG